MRFLLWPFELLWQLVAFIVGITGRFVSVIIGLILMVVGFVLCLTVIGAVVGIPLIILGLALVARGIF